MKRGFTLIELLVVIAIISALTAIGLPVMRRVREQAGETVCRSNLRQMALMVKTYGNDHDGLLPPPGYIYHSRESFSDDWTKVYLPCCRWHDARMGLDSSLLRQEHPELRGSLWAYLGDVQIVRCKVGYRANAERGCHNLCMMCGHDPQIDVVPQYTYTMSIYLHTTLTTGRSETDSMADGVDARTIRRTGIYKETQVTRSPSEVFVFGEENSWAINTAGQQPTGPIPQWEASYDLSGKYYPFVGMHGTIGSPALDIQTTYQISDKKLVRKEHYEIGDAFATCHRPRKGDLNTGHSYVSMLDGHVRQVTVADQLRRSRQVPFLPESRLGPGGNLHLAWPLNVPPPGGWENQ